ncbi:hypothetical protein QFZ78_006681 [Paenibacillus sp. V4I5]|nr:hypothetical protein [Paenibacillus sp. V4I5]
MKKTRKDVSLHDPIGTDKEGNEITLIDILGTEADDVVDKVQLKIEKSKSQTLLIHAVSPPCTKRYGLTKDDLLCSYLNKFAFSC